MYSNTDIIIKILKQNGYTLYDVYNLLGENRRVYTSAEENRWTRSMLQRISDKVGVDLTMYANSEVDRGEGGR